MNSLFEKLMGELGQQEAVELIDGCMTFDPKIIKKIPVRYRTIALGFINRLSLEELNRKLSEAGCETLYARNYWEATLIFAFSHHLDYKKWKDLVNRSKEKQIDTQIGNQFFQNNKISRKELEQYVQENSKQNFGEIVTQHRTVLLQEKIEKLPQTADMEEEFYRFAEQNREEFSTVREKTRYYFCKYLIWYIQKKEELYLQAISTGFGMEDALEDLLVLKGISALKKSKKTEKEIREILGAADLSCGNLYDVFNQFYFEYVSADWMEVLLEYYGYNLKALPSKKKAKLAAALRNYQKEWKKLSDDQVIDLQCKKIEEQEQEQDRIYSLDGTGKGYQKNRSGEKSIRKYIRGELDIDRTTLICYLLFFGYDLSVEKERMITRERLNRILTECRLPILRTENEFDYFVIQYLQAEDPVDYLMESVTAYALEEKNFFLYHMYLDSISNDQQLRVSLGI